MKRTELILSIILIPLDFLMFIGASLTAYFLRFDSVYTSISPVIVNIPLGTFFPIVFVTSIILLFIFALNGLYTISSPRRILHEIYKVSVAISFGLVVVVFILFFNRDLFSSRFIILATWALSIFFVIIGRLIVRIIRFVLYKKGVGVKRILLVGAGKTAVTLKKFFDKHPTFGYKIILELQNITPKDISSLSNLIIKNNIDEIFYTNSDKFKGITEHVIDIARDLNVIYKYVPDLYGCKITNIDVMPLAGIPIVALKRTRLEKWGYIYKRLFDICGSIILIILTSPILILVSMFLHLESKGSVIYKNKRIGKKGKTFFVYKFRTMYLKYCTGVAYDKYGLALEEENQLIERKSTRKGPLYKVLNDPRRTRIGQVLEKTSIDELPQLFNVLLGNMSLVGPRPHQPREVKKYERRHKQLLEINPGITGLAQISGRSDLDFEDEANLDIFYIENWSFWLDLIILLKTPIILLRGHKN